MSLMLHCGAGAITRQALTGVLPSGALGSRHNPVPYAEFVDLVDESLSAAGYRIAQESFGTLADGGRFFGLMEVEPKGEYISKKDYALNIGLRGSYDQSLPRGLAVGSRVFVCDNLAFSGEIVMNTKQTTFIRERLPALVVRAIDQVGRLEGVQDMRFDTYKNTALAHRHGDAALTELLRRDVLNGITIKRAVKEWDEPTHPEHLEHGRTLWTLHNAVTEAIKPGNDRPAILGNQARTIPMTRFFDEIAGVSF